MSTIVVEMTAKDLQLWRSMQKWQQSQRGVEQGYGKVGRASSEAARKSSRAGQQTAKVGQAVKSQIMGIAGALGLTGGLAGAIGLVRQGFENWLDVMREISAEAKQAADEIIAFAALQEGGTKAERVKLAAALGTRYGVTERGEAFDTVQAMQSMLGDFEGGMKDAARIFRASQIGIPVELGKELETLGISAGMQPGEALLKAFAAGEMSGRTPKAMARAAEALPYFQNKDFMFAAAASLAGAVREEQLPTYTKRLGQALMETSGLRDWFEGHGVGKGATQFERLRALQEAGVTTHVALKEAGVSELRERQALVSTLVNFDRVARDMEKLPEVAREGLLVQKRAGVERELPWMTTRRELDILGSMYADLKAFGEKAPDALRLEKEQAVRAIALKEMGKETVLGLRTFREGEGEGAPPQATWWDRFKFWVGETLAAPPPAGPGAYGYYATGQQARVMESEEEIRRRSRRIRRELAETAPGVDTRAARDLSRAAGEMSDAARAQREAADQLKAAVPGGSIRPLGPGPRIGRE